METPHQDCPVNRVMKTLTNEISKLDISDEQKNCLQSRLQFSLIEIESKYKNLAYGLYVELTQKADLSQIF